MKIKIREIKKAEYGKLENFLYEAIFVLSRNLPKKLWARRGQEL